MTDKPDVAALVEWLQTWSPVTANGKRAHLAADLIEAQASELTRLVAERDEIKAEVAATMNRLVNFNLEMTRELSTAKAEIARLRALLEPFAESAAYYELFGIYGGVPVRHLRDARAALRSDTVTINAKVGYMSPEYQAALKPDTGEKPSGYWQGYAAGYAHGSAALKPDTGEDDGQPTEQEEWLDYDRDC